MFFDGPEDFRAWLEEHHESADELWMGLHKKHVEPQGLTWAQAVPEGDFYAACFRLKRSFQVLRIQRVDISNESGLLKRANQQPTQVKVPPAEPVASRTWRSMMGVVSPLAKGE